MIKNILGRFRKTREYKQSKRERESLVRLKKKKEQPNGLTPKEKARLYKFADLIGKAILTIRAQDFSQDSVRKLTQIANIIRNIYYQDKDIGRIMHGITDAITGTITFGDVTKLEELSKEFRDYIRKI